MSPPDVKVSLFALRERTGRPVGEGCVVRGLCVPGPMWNTGQRRSAAVRGGSHELWGGSYETPLITSNRRTSRCSWTGNKVSPYGKNLPFTKFCKIILIPILNSSWDKSDKCKNRCSQGRQVVRNTDQSLKCCCTKGTIKFTKPGLSWTYLCLQQDRTNN